MKYDGVYNRIAFSLPAREKSVSIRLVGNMNERSPSDIHDRYIVMPLKCGNYLADLGTYNPKYVFEVKIDENSVLIKYREEIYFLNEGENELFTLKEYQSSYDGPQFTAYDSFTAYLTK